MWKNVAVAALTVVPSVLGAITITSDSLSQSANPITNAVDGVRTTFWHSQYSPTLAQFPHTVYLDLGSALSLSAFTYLPRQDSSNNGNIGQYTLASSTDNTTWSTISSASFPDTKTVKSVSFDRTSIRYFRLVALTEAGNRGNWSNAAEFGYVVAPDTSTKGSWGAVIQFPLVPAGAFVEYTTGIIMTFSAYKANTFSIGAGAWTLTASYDPSSGTVSPMNVSNTKHDMFCPGMSLDFDGKAVVTGGDTISATSIFDAASNVWVAGPAMKIPRGYQSTTTVSTGKIFNIGGSWSGGTGGKNGEIYDPIANTWTLLPGAPVAPILTADRMSNRRDNHAWLFAWTNGTVFQAGPSKAMNWYSSLGTGSRSAAGTRGTDPDSMCGVAVMYDAVAGKIFTAGGSPNYQDSSATKNVNLITIGASGTTPTVAALTSMTYARAFHNAVVLPNGQVFVTGGQPYAVPFTDTDAVLSPELWDPVNQTFTILPPHVVPRTYHSIALLMLDGRVFTGGGGLCGNCATNHADAEIYSPAYLYGTDGSLATRPIISSVSSSTLSVGSTFTITTNTATTSFSIIRYGSTTHTVNTDQRRIVLVPTSTDGTTYTFSLPSDPGVALPGYWMLWAMNAAGTPSVASTLKITL